MYQDQTDLKGQPEETSVETKETTSRVRVREPQRDREYPPRSQSYESYRTPRERTYSPRPQYRETASSYPGREEYRPSDRSDRERYRYGSTPRRYEPRSEYPREETHQISYREQFLASQSSTDEQPPQKRRRMRISEVTPRDHTSGGGYHHSRGGRQEGDHNRYEGRPEHNAPYRERTTSRDAGPYQRQPFSRGEGRRGGYDSYPERPYQDRWSSPSSSTYSEEERSYYKERYNTQHESQRRYHSSDLPRPPRREYTSDSRRPTGYRERRYTHNDERGAGRRPRGQAPFQKYPPKSPTPVEYTNDHIDPEKPMRLNKYLANSGVCSRRDADSLIVSGNVTVNGEVVTELGSKITLKDSILVNGKEVKPERKIYVLLNKPRNCVTTSDDPQERLTVLDLVKNACSERIYPVGRLDRNTTGVLLLTNDGDMASKLVHPSFKKKKIYHVWLDREISVEDLQKLSDGIELEDGEMHADAISYVSEEDLTQVGIEIHSGRNRIVRRLFEHLGYHVYKLDRVYFAGLTKKNLSRGKWRHLTQEEVDMLRMGAFE